MAVEKRNRVCMPTGYKNQPLMVNDMKLVATRILLPSRLKNPIRFALIDPCYQDGIYPMCIFYPRLLDVVERV